MQNDGVGLYKVQCCRFHHAHWLGHTGEACSLLADTRHATMIAFQCTQSLWQHNEAVIGQCTVLFRKAKPRLNWVICRVFPFVVWEKDCVTVKWGLQVVLSPCISYVKELSDWMYKMKIRRPRTDPWSSLLRSFIWWNTAKARKKDEYWIMVTNNVKPQSSASSCRYNDQIKNWKYYHDMRWGWILVCYGVVSKCL